MERLAQPRMVSEPRGMQLTVIEPKLNGRLCDFQDRTTVFNNIITYRERSLPFNCGRWFAANIVSDAIYSLNLINDACRNETEEVVW